MIHAWSVYCVDRTTRPALSQFSGLWPLSPDFTRSPISSAMIWSLSPAGWLTVAVDDRARIVRIEKLWLLELRDTRRSGTWQERERMLQWRIGLISLFSAASRPFSNGRPHKKKWSTWAWMKATIKFGLAFNLVNHKRDTDNLTRRLLHYSRDCSVIARRWLSSLVLFDV